MSCERVRREGPAERVRGSRRGEEHSTSWKAADAEERLWLAMRKAARQPYSYEAFRTVDGSEVRAYVQRAAFDGGPMADLIRKSLQPPEGARRSEAAIGQPEPGTFHGEPVGRATVLPGWQVFSTVVYDSARWDCFEFRPDDIVISTPPKCGTTWTQMIVALLVFQTPDLPAPLANLSPWLDMRTRSRKEVVDDLSGQSHRRFIKTHTPLSGLPVAEGVTYICVGRDPRDVALSMSEHMDNLDFGRLMALNAAAAEADGAAPPPVPQPPPPNLDRSPEAAFWRWVLDDSPVGQATSSLRRTVSHVQSFWDERDHDHLVFVHYQDLKDDLEAEMRRLADRLGIDVPDARWPALVGAAGFESMRSRASVTAPNTDGAFWLDTTAFFRRGRSGAWPEVLRTGEDIRRYDERVAALGSPDLLEWLHRS